MDDKKQSMGTNADEMDTKWARNGHEMDTKWTRNGHWRGELGINVYIERNIAYSPVLRLIRELTYPAISQSEGKIMLKTITILKSLIRSISDF